MVLSREEVARLIAATRNPKHRAALSAAYGAGLRASEVISLKVGDIDSQRMTLRVEQGKGRKDRYAMLSPVLLERLRAWWRVAHAEGKMLPGGLVVPRPRSDRSDDPAAAVCTAVATHRTSPLLCSSAPTPRPHRRPGIAINVHRRPHPAAVAQIAIALARCPSTAACPAVSSLEGCPTPALKPVHLMASSTRSGRCRTTLNESGF